MANPTNPQVLALWLVACSKRSDPAFTGASAIPLDDADAMMSKAGVDITQGDGKDAADFLSGHSEQLANIRPLFLNLLRALDYDPPECPDDPFLKALSSAGTD